MKRKPRPRLEVPIKAQRMVSEYIRMGYAIVPWRDKCLIRMEKDGKVPVYILSYTSEGKVHPLAGVSLIDREKVNTVYSEAK